MLEQKQKEIEHHVEMRRMTKNIELGVELSPREAQVTADKWLRDFYHKRNISNTEMNFKDF